MVTRLLAAFSLFFSAGLLLAANVRIVPADSTMDQREESQVTPLRAPIKAQQPATRERSAPDRSEPMRPDIRPSNAIVGSTNEMKPASGSRTRIVPRFDGPAPERHGAIASNTEIIRNVERNQRVEIVPNQTYWHNVDGVRYAHTYRGGHHWYGFYFGPRFYWTRYYNSHWWWFDASYDRWLYWSGGHWCWPGPGGVVYVYLDRSYYPREAIPASVAPPVDSPAPQASKGGGWTSPDRKRLVQIYGGRSEAFLYDNTGEQPTYLAYLGANAERVRFSGGTDGKPMRILVDFTDGRFALFDNNGAPVDSENAD